LRSIPKRQPKQTKPTTGTKTAHRAFAEDFFEEVFRVIGAAAEQPKMWRLWPGVPARRGVRRALVERFPFAIAYVIHEDAMKVLAVGHQRRKPRYWLKRLQPVS
jgi:toxin ParE1/3/4